MHHPIAYLHLVPAEIWIACWALCSVRQLRRISLVCHLFRTFSLPLLLEHQTFDLVALGRGIDRDNWVDRVHHLHRTAVRLDRLAAVEGRLATFVRSWAATFMGPHDPSIGPYRSIKNIELLDVMHQRILRTFCNTLRLYRNLSCLRIEGFKIDGAFCETLMSLPALKDLHLRNCTVGVGAHRIRNALRSLQLPNTSFLLDFFSGKAFPNLLDLSIGVLDDVETFVRFLEHCPRVESLTIDSLDPDSPLPSIHPSALKLLHTLCGPAELIHALAPNRPIGRATITAGNNHMDPQEMMLACEDLLRSTAPIHALALPRTSSPTIGFLQNILSLFPDLREFFMATTGSSRVVIEIDCRRSPREPDTRLPILCDATAFNELSAEDVSDDEAEAPSFTLVKGGRRPSAPVRLVLREDGFEEILGWVAYGSVCLPPNIEVFRVEEYKLYVALELPQQQQAVSPPPGGRVGVAVEHLEMERGSHNAEKQNIFVVPLDPYGHAALEEDEDDVPDDNAPPPVIMCSSDARRLAIEALASEKQSSNHVILQERLHWRRGTQHPGHCHMSMRPTLMFPWIVPMSDPNEVAELPSKEKARWEQTKERKVVQISGARDPHEEFWVVHLVVTMLDSTAEFYGDVRRMLPTMAVHVMHVYPEHGSKDNKISRGFNLMDRESHSLGCTTRSGNLSSLACDDIENSRDSWTPQCSSLAKITLRIKGSEKVDEDTNSKYLPYRPSLVPVAWDKQPGWNSS
ncbi:hypothetical protein B0H13DRAFT_1861836 [Mycena leptocephala]|nr:hypothetical protein B0H13DRAFT_1861836 [Mycena leptocephala]